jgi:hypothetical protein
LKPRHLTIAGGNTAPRRGEKVRIGTLFSRVLPLDNLAEIRLMHFIALTGRSSWPMNGSQAHYSITSSASASKIGGTAMPSAFAVF